MDASGNVFGYQVSVLTITTAGFSYSAIGQGTVWVTDVYWFAFLDDNIHTQVKIYSSPTTAFTIPFNTILSVTPQAVLFLSGIEFSAGSVALAQSFTMGVGVPTTAGVSVTLTPAVGNVISLIVYSIIYADPMYLTAGYQAYNVVTPTLTYVTFSVFTPIANLNSQYMGVGLVAFDIAINIRFEILLSPTPGSVVAYSWGGTYTNGFSVSYFQYQPCPLYCTSCTSGFLACVSCIPSTLRTSADCTTCTAQYYPITGQLNCAACLSICNLCSGTASSCLGCYGGRTNLPSCDTCVTVNMFVQIGLVACQSCASYCNGCISASTSCSACLASTGRLTSPSCTTCPATQFILAGVDNCQTCNSNCDSCINSASQCLSCSAGSQTLITPNCLTCPTQMFLLSLSCQACSTLCNNCSITSKTILEGFFIQIQMQGNEHQLNSLMNTYDQVDVNSEFLQLIDFDPDLLTYQASYIDSIFELNLVQFNYVGTTIVIDNFIKGQIIQDVKFRVKIQNSGLSSTSVATQNIQINMPPQQCQILIQPRGSRYIIQVTSCISQSQQLQYQLLYYTSNASFIEDSKSGSISKGLILKDFQISSTFNLYLTGSNDSVLVCIIKDSFNGQSNSSTTLRGLKFIDLTTFSEMLQTPLNPEVNLLFILMYVSANNLTLNSIYLKKIQTSSNKLNQSDPLTWQIQQLLSAQQSPTNSEIISRLQIANFYINNISSQTTLIQSQQKAGLYNKDYSIQLNQLNFDISAASGYVSNLYGISQQIRTRRILEFTAYDNITQNITQYVTQAVSNLTDMIDKLVKVNQNQKSINTTQFNFSAQKFSSLAINQQFGIQILNNSNQTASYKNQQFGVNPYQNYSDFINPVKAQYVVPNLTDHNSVQIEPANAIPFAFPLIGNITIQCASRIGGSWSFDVCSVVQSSTTVQCVCQKLSPLSISEALEFILSQFALLFKHEIQGKINQFLYQNTLFTYIITVFVIMFIASKFILSKKDSLDIVAIHPVVLQESPIINSADELDNFHSQKVIEGVVISSIKTITQFELYKPESLLGLLTAEKITKKEGYIQFLQNSHVIFELYFRFDMDEPRILRLSILFLQQFGQICIFVLFGKNLAISIVIGLSLLQTVYGILFQLILSKMLKSKNRIIHSLGIIFAIFLTGFCTYLTVASMALYSSSYQANIAALSYLASFIADYFVSNVVVELLKYLFIIRTCNSDSFYKLFGMIISPGLQELVFGRKLIPPQKKI